MIAMRADDAARLEAERSELKKKLKDEQGLSDGEADRIVAWGRDAVGAGTEAFLGLRPSSRSWHWTAVGFIALAIVAIVFIWFAPNE